MQTELHVVSSSAMSNEATGTCEHCGKSFGYTLLHCGFGDCSYAYCEKCGMTAILSLWDKRMPKLSQGAWGQQEIPTDLEQYMQPCECGGFFKRGSSPRCPRCSQGLSAEIATTYIERNAPGTKKGWKWQRSWHAMYCMVIENRRVANNFREQ